MVQEIDLTIVFAKARLSDGAPQESDVGPKQSEESATRTWSFDENEKDPKLSADTVLPMPHAIHTRMESGISSLLAYEDEARERLMVVTFDGVVSIYSTASGWEPEQRERIAFNGLRLDRFHLGRSARAASVVFPPIEEHVWSLRGKVPALLVGGTNGEVKLESLTFPVRSQRRTDAVKEWAEQLWEGDTSSSDEIEPQQRS